MRMKWVGGLLVLALSAVYGRADEGRTPVYQPLSISAPGHYVVTRNIEGSGTLIAIAASNVTLDLNGFSLTGTSTLAPVVTIVGDQVVIRDGRIAGGTDGVSGGGRVRLERVEFVNNGDEAFQTASAVAVDVISCRIVNPGGNGLQIAATLGATARARLEGNSIDVGSKVGVDLASGVTGEILGNLIRTRLRGIDLAGPGNRVERNTVQGGGAGGIGIQVLQNGNTLRGNVINGFAGTGIRLAAGDNRVLENTVQGGTADGVLVEASRNLIEGNFVEGNGGYGVNFVTAGAHAYRNNMLRGNGAGAVGGASNTDAGGNIAD